MQLSVWAGGRHSDDIGAEFTNISIIIKLPLHSVELNSIEQVWSWIRQHHLANQIFKGYEHMVDKVCSAWNDFISIPNRVINTYITD